MKNNKGFTVVELLASFTLTMIIVVFLFEIVLDLKNVYMSNTVRAKVLNKNATIAARINSEISDKNISYTVCENNECTIYYDTDCKSIVVKLDAENNKMMFTGDNNKSISFPENTTIKSYNFQRNYIYDENVGIDNAIVKISYTIESDFFEKDVTFNYTYSYHEDAVSYCGIEATDAS